MRRRVAVLAAKVADDHPGGDRFMPWLEVPVRCRASLGAVILAVLLCVGLPGPAVGGEPQASPSDELSFGEAADFLGLSYGVLGQLAEWRQIPARRVGGEWRFRRSELANWLANDWSARAVGGSGDPVVSPRTYPSPSGFERARVTAPLSQASLRDVAGRGEAPDTAADPGSDGSSDDRIGEAPADRTADEIFLRGQRVLLARGEFVIDPGLFYARSDDQVLASIGGGAGLATVEQDSFTALLSGRYGLFEETELFASTTYRHTETKLFFGDSGLDESSRSEFGDVGIGLRRTLLREDLGVPDVIVTLEGRIPTGESSYAVGGGIALVKSFDPAVLFANVNYLHTFSRDFADITRLEPDDRVTANVGYALALNNTLTISASVTGVFTSSEQFTAADLRSREQYTLQLGLTAWLAEDLYIEPIVSFALNGPGNSVLFGVTLPYTFEP